MGLLNEDEIIILFGRACKGDKSAFDEIVQNYGQSLLRHIQAGIYSHSVQDAEEIAQDAWSRLYIETISPNGTGGFNPAAGKLYTYILNRYVKFMIFEWNRKWRVKTEKEMYKPSVNGSDPEDFESRRMKGANWPEDRSLNIFLRLAAFNELFRLVFLCGGFPHQVLAFGYSKLIYGKPSGNMKNLRGSPAKTANNHGEVPLEKLTADFTAEYNKALGFYGRHSEIFKEYIIPLWLRIPFRLNEIMRHEANSLKVFDGILEKRAAETCLKDYYDINRKGYTSAIPDWCDDLTKRIQGILRIGRDSSRAEVENRVEAMIGSKGEEMTRCCRCSLRDLPPCRQHTGV